MEWAVQEAGMVAPKVTVQATTTTTTTTTTENNHTFGGQRGLFATETIYPGERILFLPSTSLIGRDALQAVGEQMLLGMQQRQPQPSIPRSLADWERVLIQRIEEFRRHVSALPPPSLSSSSSSHWSHYEWRGDDAVALYLAAARSLLRHMKLGDKKRVDGTPTEPDVNHQNNSHHPCVPALPPTNKNGNPDRSRPAQTSDPVFSTTATSETTTTVTSETTTTTIPMTSAQPLTLDHNHSRNSATSDHAVKVLPAPAPTKDPPNATAVAAAAVFGTPYQPEPSVFTFPHNHIIDGEDTAILVTATPATTIDDTGRSEVAESDTTSGALEAHWHAITAQQDQQPPPPPPPQLRYPSFLQHVERLPDSFPTSPLYFRPEELARIEGTNCHGYAVRMQEQIEADWQRLSQALTRFQRNRDEIRQQQSPVNNSCESRDPLILSLDDGPHHWYGPDDLKLDELVCFESYKWALVTIYSRSTDFFVQSIDTRDSDEESDNGGGHRDHNHGHHHYRVIAPLFDMMNHDFGSSVTHSLDSVHGDLSVFNGSSQAIEANQEIFLSYGNFPNEKLLLIYGFVVPGNPFDCVAIYAPILPSDPYFLVKARILQNKCGIDNVNEPHVLRIPPPPPHHGIQNDGEVAIGEGVPPAPVATGSILPPSLLSVLRVVGIRSADDIMALTDIEDDARGGIGMISVENEHSALSALQQALYNMTRQLALNMISDANLAAGSSSTRPLPTPDENEQENYMRINFANAKVLCQSEYHILQVALTEIAERLSALEGHLGVEQ